MTQEQLALLNSNSAVTNQYKKIRALLCSGLHQRHLTSLGCEPAGVICEHSTIGNHFDIYEEMKSISQSNHHSP